MEQEFEIITSLLKGSLGTVKSCSIPLLVNKAKEQGYSEEDVQKRLQN